MLEDPGRRVARLTEELRQAKAEQRARVLAELGEAYREIGKPAKGLACCEQAWDSGHREVAFLRQFAAALGAAGQERRGIEILAAAPDTRQEPIEHGRILAVRSRLLWRLGEYEESESLSVRAREWLTQHQGPAVDIADCWNLLGMCRIRTGKYHEATTPLERARDLYAEAGDVAMRLKILNNLGIVAMGLGNYDEALRNFDSVRVEGERADLVLPTGLGWMNRALVHKDRREFEEATSCLAEAQRLLAKTGDQLWTWALAETTAIVAADAEDWATVRLQATRCLDHARQAGDRPHESAALRLLASMDLAAGKPRAAMEKAIPALTLAQAEGSRELTGLALRVLGEIEVAVGDVESGIRRLEESANLSRVGNAPFEEALSRVALAKALHAAGRPGEARRQLEPARATFHRVGSPRWIARVDTLLAG